MPSNRGNGVPNRPMPFWSAMSSGGGGAGLAVGVDAATVLAGAAANVAG